MRSVVTFVNCIHAIEITQFWRLGTTHILIFCTIARKPPHHNGCGPLPKKAGHACPDKKRDEGWRVYLSLARMGWITGKSRVTVFVCLSVCLKVGTHNIKCNTNLYGFHEPYVDWTSYLSPFRGFYFVVVAISQFLTGTPFPIMETCFIKLKIPYIRLKSLCRLFRLIFFKVLY
jgi:hypothetical protein